MTDDPNSPKSGKTERASSDKKLPAKSPAARPAARRRLFEEKNQAPIPAELEKWELRGGFITAFLALAILIFFLESVGLHIVEKVAVAHHKGHYRYDHIDLVPEFWIGVALAIGSLFATYYNRRQLLALTIVFEGLMLVSFASQFDPIIPLPFVIFGVWLMLRASRRTRQLAAAGQGPAARRANRARSGSAGSSRSAEAKGSANAPGSSKRYTPPKPRKNSTATGPSTVGIGRGGMIRGDLPRKTDDDDEEPGGLLGKFAGRKRPTIPDDPGS